ncbi:MAG: spore germination protein [Clostridiales bacterium]|nr:spore germination protein [Clostridiales bacterium]HBM81356.1 spore germination protein [Clostridiaceae bacterium]
MKKISGYTYDANDGKDEVEKVPIPKNIDETNKKLKDIFKDCNDIIFREFNVGTGQKLKYLLICVDGLSDKMLVDNFVLESLMLDARKVKPDAEEIKSRLFDLTKNGTLATTELREEDDLNKVIDGILSADTALFMDGFDKAIVIGTKLWPARQPQEPKSEGVVRGPSDGFVETLRFNTALVRRRIRDPKFKVKQMKIGYRSKTDIAVMYIEDIVKKDILQKVFDRLNSIKIDGIIESGYVEQFIEDDIFSPFPQVKSTERPDAVAAEILEGRVGIIVDNSPFVLIVPGTLIGMLHSSEDYYQRWIIATFVRGTRITAAIFSLLLPALYIAITSYNPDIIPYRFALSIAGSREGVPFPAFIEAIIMELSLELLREAGVRLPDPIGGTIGIVGGIIIGQAAVSAKIVSPIMVIIVSITAISSFTIPNFGLNTGMRIVRFVLMILAAVLGLYGVMLGLIALLIHLVNLKSFGVPYLAPFAGMSARDFKDSVVRFPIRSFIYRPEYLQANDKKRMALRKKR